jgi:tripartite-type tricarboxylate transporter receptor subunit TctC
VRECLLFARFAHGLVRPWLLRPCNGQRVGAAFDPPTQFGQNIMVEDRLGGGATTAATFVAKADPDGYTILVNSAAHTIAPALHLDLRYNPATDFSAVALLGGVPSVLVVSRDSGFKTVADFVAAARARPGAMVRNPSPCDALHGERWYGGCPRSI